MASTVETVAAFAALVDRGGRVVRILEQARALPQATLPEVQHTLAQMEFEGATTLAEIAAFAIAHQHELMPALIAPPAPPTPHPSPTGGEDVVSYLRERERPPERAPERVSGPESANPFLSVLAPR